MHRRSVCVLLLCLACASSGCSMCSGEREVEPTTTSASDPPPRPSPVTPRAKVVLERQLDHLRQDQRARSADIAGISEHPAFAEVKRSLSQGQVKVALATQRLDRRLERGDPEVVAYERELGRLLARQHRLLRVLREIAEAEQLLEELALIEELEAEYARSIIGYRTFDSAFDHAFRDVDEGWAAEVDVEAALASATEEEIFYTFALYFDDEQYEHYSDAIDLELPPEEEMTRWASWEGDGFEGDAEALEYVEVSIETLEERYELEAPEYYDDLVSDEAEPEEDLEANFDTMDAQLERIYETEPDELEAQYDDYFDEDESDAPVEDGTLEGSVVEEPEDVGEGGDDE